MAGEGWGGGRGRGKAIEKGRLTGLALWSIALAFPPDVAPVSSLCSSWVLAVELSDSFATLSVKSKDAGD